MELHIRPGSGTPFGGNHNPVIGRRGITVYNTGETRPSCSRVNESMPSTANDGLPRGVNPWIIAGAVTIATFMEVLDTSIANVALRYIAGGLSAAESDSEWIITS